MKKLLEKHIQRQIIEYLSLKGYMFWRNNTGAFKREDGHFYRFGQSGSPDIFVVKALPEICPPNEQYGQIYGIEVKAPKGKQSPAQEEWQKRFEEAGGVYLVTRSLEDLQKELKL